MNAIQEAIQRAIEVAKSHPKGTYNAKYRNKVIARLEDAELAASRFLNMDNPANQPLPDAPPAGQCTCLPGTYDEKCTVHSHLT